MKDLKTTPSSTQRRIAAQAVRATEARLAMTPAQADAAVRADLTAKEIAPMTTVTTPALDLQAVINAAIAKGVAEAMAKLTTAAPVAPTVVEAPAPKATGATPENWAKHTADKVVDRLNALGKPLNKHGQFIKASEAIDPKGLLKGASVAKNAKAAPASANVAANPAPAGPAGLTLEQLANFLRAMGIDPAVASAVAEGTVATTEAPKAPEVAPTAGIRAVLRSDGAWLHCPHGCDKAYWAATRDDAFLTAKYAKHMAKAHAGS